MYYNNEDKRKPVIITWPNDTKSEYISIQELMNDLSISRTCIQNSISKGYMFNKNIKIQFK